MFCLHVGKRLTKFDCAGVSVIERERVEYWFENTFRKTLGLVPRDEK